MELTGAEIIVRFLQDEGVEHLFGYPGGAVLHIYDALYKQEKTRPGTCRTSGEGDDTAEMLTLEPRGLLEGELRAYEDSTSTQIVILTVASLEGEVLEEYAYRVADTWRLGRRGKDNGVLLLVARDERKVRIEVGTGLEGVLTDAMAGIIIRRVIVPHFKRGDFDRGVLEGARAIMQAGSGAFTAEEAEDSSATPWPVLLFGMGIFLLTVGITTARAAVVPGFGSWFLYLFLIPFWFAFPTAFKISDQDARLMVRRSPTDNYGEFYRLWPEGILRECDGYVVKYAQPLEGLDFNRNFPFEWRTEDAQSGAGPFPASEPETRALIEFIISHPNINLALTCHTFSRVILRPFSTKPDDEMETEDYMGLKKNREYRFRADRVSLRQYISGIQIQPERSHLWRLR